ncbi:MAG: hypothetical protein ACYTG5_01230 [Planctomycetota bacterium]|jgi:hypothetical protein
MTTHADSLPTPAREKRNTLPAIRLDIALITGLVLALVACTGGSDPASQEAELIARVEAAYEQQLAMIDPDYVVVTYPESISALSGFKKLEFDVIRLVLRQQDIRHEFRTRPECIEQILVGKGKSQKEYQAFILPAAAIESCQGGLLLYLNLDVEDPVYSSRHPEATKRDITVKVWNDPITLPESWLKLYSGSKTQGSKS